MSELLEQIKHDVIEHTRVCVNALLSSDTGCIVVTGKYFIFSLLLVFCCLKTETHLCEFLSFGLSWFQAIIFH